MTRGIKISNRKDIPTASEEELYVNSTTPLFKLFKSDKGTQRFSGGAGETHNIAVNHGLGRAPFIMCFMDRNPGANRRLCTTSESILSTLPQDISAFVFQVTSNDFTIQTSSGGGVTGDFGFNYYIYYDRITEIV